MKSTGIVRTIDDLGRIIIPKEIRRTLHIREGDRFEILVENDDVIFHKFDEARTVKKALAILKETIIENDALPDSAKSEMFQSIFEIDARLDLELKKKDD